MLATITITTIKKNKKSARLLIFMHAVYHCLQQENIGHIRALFLI